MDKLILGVILFVGIILASFWFGEQVAVAGTVGPLYMILAVAAMILSFFQPKMGLALMIFSVLLLPGTNAGTLQGDIAGNSSAMSRGITLRPEDFIILVVCIGWLAQAAITKIIGSRSQSQGASFIPFIYLFIVMMLVSSFVGSALQTTTFKRSFFFFTKRVEYFMIFFMTINVISSFPLAIRYLKLFLSVSAVVIGLGVVDIAVSHNIIATSTFGGAGANVLASFLLVLFPIILHLHYRSIGTRRLQWLLYLAATGFSLLYTRSRGAYVAFPFSFLVYVFFTRRYKLIFPFLIILAVGWTLLPKEIRFEFTSIEKIVSKKTRLPKQLIQRKINTMTPAELAVFVSRMDIEPSWRARVIGSALVLDLIKRNPVLGGGLGSVDLSYTDNQYAMDAASLGILGTLTFFLLIYQIAQFLIRFWRRVQFLDPWTSSLTIGFLSGLAGMMVHAMTITNFYTIRNMVAFWFLLGLIVVIHRELENRQVTSKNIPANRPLLRAERLRGFTPS